MTESKSKTLKQLAQEYQVHPDTFKKWLVRAKLLAQGEKRKGYIFTPLEVKEIYEKLGDP